MSTRAVLFDLDGTLADTAPDLALALNRLRGERGLAPLPDETTRPHTSRGVRGLLSIGLGLEPGNEHYDAISNRFLEYYAENLCVHTRLFEDVPELLATLEARGTLWGVVTNKASRFTDPLIELLALRHRAACVVSGDTTQRIKPAPDSLLYAAAAMAVPPAECLYVGDDLRDVQAGHSAGMRVLAAAWGYLGAGSDPCGWNAEAVIQAPAEVLNFL